jgi:signal transduction histidine kinase
MGMGRWGRQPRAAAGQGRADDIRGRDDRRDRRETRPNHLLPVNREPQLGLVRRSMAFVRGYLPRGNTLSPETFRQRHDLLCWVLALHLPALFVFGIGQVGASHSAMEIVVPGACLIFARVARNRRLAAFFVTAGLVFCSSVLVHLSGGTIEAHFHFFILIGLIALYQDWVPFLWNVVFTVLSHGLGSSIAANLMYNHDAAQNRPWSWAVIHGVAVLAACVGVIIFWKNTELEQQRNSKLTTTLVNAQAEAAQRQTVSELFVNLARRNQTLLDRQLTLIAELEQRERDPEALGELFQLDHLATRIRRNAESLLVLSGENSPRRWGRPVALGELVRAAAAEVEDYARVDVLVNDHLEVVGRAVADLAHLLAELLENATTFSPPDCDVKVRSHLAPGDWSTYVVSIEDTGVGMPPEDMHAANRVLADPPEVDLRGAKLGFHVVGRLAKRYGLEVHLAPTPGGGVTALVTVPDGLVTERRQPAPVAAGTALAEVTGSTPVVQAVPDEDHRERMGLWSSSWHLTVGSSPDTSEPPTQPTTDPVFARTSLAEGAPEPLPARPTYAEPVDVPVPVPVPGPTPARVPVAAGAMPAMGGRTADGLVRRVPGAGLAAGLRRSAEAVAPSTGGAAARPAPGARFAPGGGDDSDRERMRTMLSRFQASQRAGRAAAQGPQHLRAAAREDA